MTLASIIRSARGEQAADLVLKNARIIDVFCGKIVHGDLAVSAGTILGIGPYKGRRYVDLEGRYLAPGFIDPHVHIESAMVVVAEFARAVVPAALPRIAMRSGGSSRAANGTTRYPSQTSPVRYEPGR
jgi:adenine deaminase